MGRSCFKKAQLCPQSVTYVSITILIHQMATALSECQPHANMAPGTRELPALQPRRHLGQGGVRAPYCPANECSPGSKSMTSMKPVGPYTESWAQALITPIFQRKN